MKKQQCFVILGRDEIAYWGNMRQCKMVKREYIANGFRNVRIFKEIA